MTGMTCVVTGANTGIGRETAIGLARLGARVVLVARNRERGERALAEVMAAANVAGRGGSGELEIADLSVQSQVRALAATIRAKYPVLDVLVNNAGLALKKRTLSADGIEMTFAVNFLAYFMLANLLLPSLLNSPKGRIVIVASGAHAALRELDFYNLQGEKRFRGYGSYAMSKLEDVMFGYALARRLARNEGNGECSASWGDRDGDLALVVALQQHRPAVHVVAERGRAPARAACRGCVARRCERTLLRQVR